MEAAGSCLAAAVVLVNAGAAAVHDAASWRARDQARRPQPGPRWHRFERRARPVRSSSPGAQRAPQPAFYREPGCVSRGCSPWRSLKMQSKSLADAASPSAAALGVRVRELEKFKMRRSSSVPANSTSNSVFKRVASQLPPSLNFRGELLDADAVARVASKAEREKTPAALDLRSASFLSDEAVCQLAAVLARAARSRRPAPPGGLTADARASRAGGRQGRRASSRPPRTRPHQRRLPPRRRRRRPPCRRQPRRRPPGCGAPALPAEARTGRPGTARPAAAAGRRAGAHAKASPVPPPSQVRMRSTVSMPNLRARPASAPLPVATRRATSRLPQPRRRGQSPGLRSSRGCRRPPTRGRAPVAAARHADGVDPARLRPRGRSRRACRAPPRRRPATRRRATPRRARARRRRHEYHAVGVPRQLAAAGAPAAARGAARRADRRRAVGLAPPAVAPREAARLARSPAALRECSLASAQTAAWVRPVKSQRRRRPPSSRRRRRAARPTAADAAAIAAAAVGDQVVVVERRAAAAGGCPAEAARGAQARARRAPGDEARLKSAVAPAVREAPTSTKLTRERAPPVGDDQLERGAELLPPISSVKTLLQTLQARAERRRRYSIAVQLAPEVRVHPSGRPCRATLVNPTRDPIAQLWASLARDRWAT